MFTSMGWQTENLHNTALNIADLEFFGFLRDPDARHSMGVAQFLFEENLDALLDQPLVQPLLVSSCFDGHSLPLHACLPDSIIQRTTWFVMDHPVFNYEKLCRNYLRERGVMLPAVPKLHESDDRKRGMRQRVDLLKQQHQSAHGKLVTGLLGADLRHYRDQIQIQHLWDRP